MVRQHDPTTGVELLRVARKILQRDWAAAFADGEWGLAVRRAQESVELATKGALLLLGRVPPKTHAPRQLKAIFKSRFPIVGFELDNEATYFLFVEITAQSADVRVSKLNAGVRIWIPASLFPPDVTPSVIVESDGREVRVFATESGTFLTSCPAPTVPAGRWVQTPITDENRRLVQNHVDKLARERSVSFYLERAYDDLAARRAEEQARAVLRVIFGAVGFELGARPPGP